MDESATTAPLKTHRGAQFGNFCYTYIKVISKEKYKSTNETNCYVRGNVCTPNWNVDFIYLVLIVLLSFWISYSFVII